MNEKRSHTSNTLRAPPSPLTGGQWVGGGVEIMKGGNRGEEMLAADRADKKVENGRKDKKRPQTLATQGRGNAKGL